MKMRNLFFIISFFLIAYAYSQERCGPTEDKTARKAYEKGIDKKKYKKEERIKLLGEAIEADPEFLDAHFAMAQIYIVTSKLKNASFKPTEPFFRKIIEVCPQYHSEPYYYLGFMFYEMERYDSASKYLKKFIDFVDDDPKKFSKDYDFQLNQSEQMLKWAKFFAEIYAKKVPFDPHPVPGLCTDKDEVLATLSPDDQTFYFTRRMMIQSKDMVFQTDRMTEIFSFAKRQKSGQFNSGEPMPYPFNRNNNEGGPSITIDNKYLFFTICKDEGGVGRNCDIWYTKFENGDWQEIKNAGPGVNTPGSWESQPSISSDGRTLFFASDRPGGLGKADIYKSTRNPNGDFAPAANLGPKINTSGEDNAPFLHSDSETLFFSSEGHPGVGGLDIFRVKKNEKGEWEEPKNIGVPINSEEDEVGLFVSTDGKYAYFASNNAGKYKGPGGYDIYYFELYKEARPKEIVIARADFKDHGGGSVPGATLEIKDAKTKTKIEAIVDTIEGTATVALDKEKNPEVIMTVKKEGYAFSSQLISLKDSTGGKVTMNTALEFKPVKVGEAYRINNINFATGSAELEAKSKFVLEEFAEFLKSNPGIKIEIHGHTDNVGNASENKQLSNLRALEVAETLKDMGITNETISGVKGFGPDKPVAPNTTEQGRAKNRRTEFVIVAI